MAEFNGQRFRSDFARAFAQVLRSHYGRPAVVIDPQVRKVRKQGRRRSSR